MSMKLVSARRRRTFLVALTVGALPLALALALAGPVFAATRTVSIDNFRYAPDPIRISVGDSIRWRNDDPVPHTATARDGGFDTGLFIGGRTTDAITFSTAGSFEYFCETHPEMSGRVIVSAASSSVPPTDTISTGRDGPPTDSLGIAVAVSAGVLGGWVVLRAIGRRSTEDRRA
jgi:plastocyanin